VHRELRESGLRVLITGGAGFIGSHAVDHFVSMGDEVTVVDKLSYAGKMENLAEVPGKFTFKQIDICDPIAMNTVFLHGGFDVVVNFAAETHVDNSINDAEPFIQTNIAGATNLMELAHHYNALFCHLSTDEVYGDALGRNVPFYTTDTLMPRNPYSATKAAADMMLLARHNTFKQPYLIFRPSNNFGPRQHKEKFLPKLLDCMLTGKDFPLYGDGMQMREWTFAPDTVRLIRETIVSGTQNKILNISSGYTCPNVDIINAAKLALNSRGCATMEVVKHVTDRPGHDRKYWIESSFAEDRFTKFASALAKTVDHYIENESR